MKILISIMAFILSMTITAQVSKVSLRASGLTCSMCSNSINKALKTLDFVDNIDADVKTYTFHISFKPNTKVDFDQIKRKVEGAGFAISSFATAIHFHNARIEKEQPVRVGDMTLLFVNSEDQLLNGVKEILIIDEGFVSSKESRKNKIQESLPGVYHAIVK